MYAIFFVPLQQILRVSIWQVRKIIIEDSEILVILGPHDEDYIFFTDFA